MSENPGFGDDGFSGGDLGSHDADMGGGADTGGGHDADTGGGHDADTGGGHDADTGGGHDADTGGGHDADTGGSHDADTGGGHDADTGGGHDADTGGGHDGGESEKSLFEMTSDAIAAEELRGNVGENPDSGSLFQMVSDGTHAEELVGNVGAGVDSNTEIGSTHDAVDDGEPDDVSGQQPGPEPIPDSNQDHPDATRSDDHPESGAAPSTGSVQEVPIIPSD